MKEKNTINLHIYMDEIQKMIKIVKEENMMKELLHVYFSSFSLICRFKRI